MNHPTPPDWMAYLYRELPPSRAADLDAHLAVCPECKAQLNQWRQTSAALDRWPLPARRRSEAWLPPALKWAAAAAIILGIGVGLGRWSGPAPLDRQALRAELEASLQARLEPALRTQLRQELDADYRALLARTFASLEATRDTDRQTVLAVHQRSDRQHAADIRRLRADLETVAVATQVSLTETRSQLGELVSYAAPAAAALDALVPNPNSKGN